MVFLLNSGMLFCFGTQASLERLVLKKKNWKSVDTLRIGSATPLVNNLALVERTQISFMEIKQHFYRCLQLVLHILFASLVEPMALCKSIKEARNVEIISSGIKCNLHFKSSVAFNRNCRSGRDVEGGNLLFQCNTMSTAYEQWRDGWVGWREKIHATLHNRARIIQRHLSSVCQRGFLDAYFSAALCNLSSFSCHYAHNHCLTVSLCPFYKRNEQSI